MGFEPTTSTLARLRSTPELRPHGAAENGTPIIDFVGPFSRPLLKARSSVFHWGTGVRASGKPIAIGPRAASKKTVSAWPPTRALYLLRLKGG